MTVNNLLARDGDDELDDDYVGGTYSSLIYFISLINLFFS
jgi:hypothetical protein